MTKRLLLSIALAAAGAFALTVAQPAYACGKDCDCAKKADATKADAKKPEVKPEQKPAEKSAPTAPAATEKKAQGTPKCECTKGGKGCTCPKGTCTCANCGAPKLAAADKAEKKACDCGKTKDCSCPKGECKCGKKSA
jgi:hypothetical protein